ncbi:unnamed protein product [Haemonchus placei]|uniref:Uncharacterized protein n=1 Tax=Haemonchus placei TaxID=6290 RepID=A0A158QNF6_HAEPC|nr:unnamed protein product [Haemonchus placei]
MMRSSGFALSFSTLRFFLLLHTFQRLGVYEGRMNMVVSRRESKEETVGTCDVAAVIDQDALSEESPARLEEIIKSVVIPPNERVAAAVTNSIDSPDVVMADTHRFELADFDQISLLVDMFYLPFECGRKALDLLEQFYWLYENALVMDTSKE